MVFLKLKYFKLIDAKPKVSVREGQIGPLLQVRHIIGSYADCKSTRYIYVFSYLQKINFSPEPGASQNIQYNAGPTRSMDTYLSIIMKFNLNYLFDYLN